MTHKRRSHHKRSGRRHKRGGSYSSAASYNEYVNGTEAAQYSRVFDQAGPYGNVPGNIIIGAQGQNAHQPGMPTAQQLALVQKAGRRRTRGKRGGIWGSVVNQAIVPFSLLGLQQSYGRRGHNNMRTRRRTFRRRR